MGTDITAVALATATGSTASNTFVDLISLGITVPTANSVLQIMFSVTTTTAAVALGQLQVLLDGVNQDNDIADHTIYIGAINTQIFIEITGISAGAHTVKGQWSTSASTISVATNTQAVLLLVVIGPQ